MTNFEAMLIIDALKGAILLNKLADDCYENRADKVAGQVKIIEALERASSALRLMDKKIDKLLEDESNGD